MAKKKAEFKKTTKQEEAKDRKDFISYELKDAIQSIDEFEALTVALRESDAIARFREEQLREGGFIKEQFNGATMTHDLLSSFHAINVRSHNNNVRRLNHCRDGLVKKHGFGDEDINKLTRGEFDAVKWKDEYLAKQTKIEKDNVDE
jgi:hypothetical protein